MIEFEVEGRAVSWNQAHGGVHWAKRKVINDEWKWRVKAALSKKRITRIALEAPCSMRFDVYVGRPIDCDNIMLKVIIDGLREWGLLTNDDPRFVKEITTAVHTKSDREYIKVSII